MWVWAYACPYTLILCVSECVFRWVYSAIYAHTLPGEIRLICQWCRSSSMINRPACWKQCYSALATCGTPIHRMCVSVFVCETAWISTLTSCTRCVDVVGLLLHKAATCRDSCELRTASLVTLPSNMHLTEQANLEVKPKSSVLLCSSPLTSLDIKH